MSVWAEHDPTTKIIDVLDGVTYDHHFGHPYLSAYQLAIELQRLYPDVVAAIGEPLGGTDTGKRSSLSQYLARELSRKIKADPDFPIEGGFLWSGHLTEMSFTTVGGALMAIFQHRGRPHGKLRFPQRPKDCRSHATT